MPLVTIEMMSGRTVEQKRKMVFEVTKAICETIDADPEKVRIVIKDVEPENISVSGQLVMDKGSSYCKYVK